MKKKQKKIIEAAAEYGGAAVGAAAGAGIGLVVAGPAGASLGAIAGTALEKAFLYIGKEITERKLSKAENKKVGNVYALASENISKKLIAGKTLREDDFFEESKTDRSSAEEILERTLFAAQREAEEKVRKTAVETSSTAVLFLMCDSLTSPRRRQRRKPRSYRPWGCYRRR